jgi:hypothetical protein
MHYVTNRACGVTLAKDLGDLTVSHYAARWYLSNDVVDAFTITLLVGDSHN